LSVVNFMTNNMFGYSDRIPQDFIRETSIDTLKEKLNTMAASMGDQAFITHVAREIVERTQPQRAVPEVYGHYRSVVRDGIEFFLSQVGRHRLVELVASQLKLDPETNPQERLLELAKRFPTLHKLGQIIARNPNIDPMVKRWLIRLENGCYGTPLGGIMERIDGQLEQAGNRNRVQVQPAILAEASVGAVIAFQWNQPSSQDRIEGVFKILKPGIRRHLGKELLILEKTAAFFEENRHRYPLKDFKFIDIFREVREMLVKEIDLAAEQTNLVEAARFYRNMDSIQIPQLLPLSTGAMTAMAYLNGPKITDAPLNQEQRRRCAAVLFESLVCRPLFSRREPSLFHGDPHAGNILAVKDPASGDLRIGLLDWSLAGRLTQRDRIKTARLIQAVIKKDLSGIRRAVKALAIGAYMNSPLKRQNFRNLVLRLVRSSDFDRLPLIKKTFKLMEHLTFEGFVFPAELMLFRKAIFTLEGVLFDLWPPFDMDAAVTQYLTTLVTREIPTRCGNLFFPLTDRPENYPSLISNTELQSLIIHQYGAAIRSGTQSLSAYFEAWSRIFGMPFWPALTPTPLSGDNKNQPRKSTTANSGKNAFEINSSEKLAVPARLWRK
jgi:ubiquinone biosynthesis protein